MERIMNTVDIHCPECDAAHTVLEGSIVLICEACGARMGIQAGSRSQGKAVAHVPNVEKELARFNELKQMLQDAREQGELENFKVTAAEYYSLFAIHFPKNVPARSRDEVKQWLRESVIADELNNFDPDVKHAFDTYARAMGDMELMEDDPVLWARKILEAATRYYRTLIEHPDCPGEAFNLPPETYARKALAPYLTSMVNMLGEDAVKSIQKEVLGTR
jgi:hypothetical protein